MHRPAAPRLALLLGLAAASLALGWRERHAAGAETGVERSTSEGQAPAEKKAEASKGEASKGEASKGEASKGEAPEGEAPKGEAKDGATGSGGAPVTLDVYGVFGPSIRIGGAPELSIVRRAGLLGGGGLIFAPLQSFALGFSFEHVDLGSERLGAGELGSATADRVMNGLWLDVRVHPLRREAVSVFGGLGLGLAWQLAAATRLEDPEGGGTTAKLTLCEASSSASVGLRAGGGLEVALGGGIFVIADAWIENARLSGEILDECIGGAGTTTLFTARAGLAYRLDLSRAFVSR